MARRLQVLLDEEELEAIQRLAKRRHLTTAAWVREALRAARDATNQPDTLRRLRAVRAAAGHAYPTADIGQMLAEIEGDDSADMP
jgi:hypothetical protein